MIGFVIDCKIIVALLNNQQSNLPVYVLPDSIFNILQRADLFCESNRQPDPAALP